VPNEPPTVATAASASPSIVTGTTTTLSVLGADDGGESNLTYTWSTTGTPPATVQLSANGTNAAKSTAAAFSAAGTYDFMVTITDAEGLSTTSSVDVTVAQSVTGLTIAPDAATVNEGATQQFVASATDQFGDSMAAPALLWSIKSGNGSVSSSGLCTGGSTFGSTTVAAKSGGVQALAAITTPDEPPVISTDASASPAPATGTTTQLEVAATDDGGPENLTYAWSAVGQPPAPVSFSVNDSNSADITTATFEKPGDYQFQLTVTDEQGESTTSTVEETVAQTLTSIAVTPGSATVGRGESVQFGATALDQFGKPMLNAPTLNWSTTGSAGTIDSTGVYTAPTAGNGAATIVATAGNISGTATVDLEDELWASVPASINTAPGIPVVFAGANGISISDADSTTLNVPVSVTVVATHGTLSLGTTSGLRFQNGSGPNGSLLTFEGNIAEIDKALRGMAYTSEAGFAGSASVTITLNESGPGASPSYSIPVDVQQASSSISGGGSSATSSGGSGSGGGSTLSGVVNGGGSTSSSGTSDGSGSSEAPGTSTLSGGVVVPASFGDTPIQGNTSSSESTPSGHTSPAPAPAPSPVQPVTPTGESGAKAGAAGAASAVPGNSAVGAGNGGVGAVSNVAFVGTTEAGVGMPFAPTGVVPDVRVTSVPEQVFPFLAVRGEMASAMDVADHKLIADQKVKIMAGSATAASFGASALYVVWLLRGGSLLSSLLSILPAWQTIDPLPVLDNFENRRRRGKTDNDDDLESLESMVDKSNGTADQGHSIDEPAKREDLFLQ
jgi:hypothetical protein